MISPLMARLVTGREAVLNRLLAISPDGVLNGEPSRQMGGDGTAIVEAINRVTNELKAMAISPDGRRVDYGRLRGSAAYHYYRTHCSPRLRHFDPATLVTREARLAFWINLYNALVIDAVIKFDIRRSVTEGPAGLLRFFRRAAYNVGGYRYSCDDIEHGILRANRGYPFVPGPHFGPGDPRRAQGLFPLDPRIHFALNCGSRSCPPIAVYDATALEQQLEVAARNFCAGEVTVIPQKRRVELPALFRWYAGDFGGKSAVVDLVLRYLPDGDDRSWLAAHRSSVQLRYAPYDWSLNV